MSIDSSFDTPEHFEEESDKSPETLEREIDQQRSSIGNIVDALEKRMSPGQLVDQALAYVKSNGGEFFDNLGANVKANPVPAVLTTVGVLWLMMGGRTPASSATPSVLDSAGERIGSVTGAVSDSFASAKARVQETASRMKDKAAHLTESVGEKLSGNSGSVATTSQSLEQGALRIKSTASQLLTEQPLTVAAIGIAVGAIIGAALPATAQEKRLLGQARERLQDDRRQDQDSAPGGVQPGQSGVTPASGSVSTSMGHNDRHSTDHGASGMTPSTAPGPDTTPGLG